MNIEFEQEELILLSKIMKIFNSAAEEQDKRIKVYETIVGAISTLDSDFMKDKQLQEIVAPLEKKKVTYAKDKALSQSIINKLNALVTVPEEEFKEEIPTGS